MSKTKYIGEFEFKASVRMLYPYLNTPDGLEKWFADNVSFDPKRNLVFTWNGEKVLAKKVSQRPNEYVKYEFIEKNGKKAANDPAYLEFNLEENEMTQTTFLQIVDYSESLNKDMEEVYGNLVEVLKEIVGG